MNWKLPLWGDRLWPNAFIRAEEFRGESSGIPHLAKNERDMGHPRSWLGEGFGPRDVVMISDGSWWGEGLDRETW